MSNLGIAKAPYHIFEPNSLTKLRRSTNLKCALENKLILYMIGFWHGWFQMNITTRITIFNDVDMFAYESKPSSP